MSPSSVVEIITQIEIRSLSAEESKSLVGLDSHIDAALASYSNTSSSALRLLAANPDPTIRKAVTSNPNTPFDCLIGLAEEFGQAFLLNPAFEHLFIENGDFFKSMPMETVGRILSYPECPPYILDWACIFYKSRGGRELIYQGIVRNPKVTDRMIEEILEDTFDGDISCQEALL